MIYIGVRPSVRGLVSAATIRRRTRRLLAQLGVEDREVSIVLTDDEEIAELNSVYRQKSGPTDVLSFPQESPDIVGFEGLPMPLGDIVVSVPTAARQVGEGCLPRIAQLVGPKRAGEWNLREEVTFLVIHGLLHLLGYDHMTEEEAREMEAKEASLLSTLLRL